MTHLSPTFDYERAEYEEIPCNFCGKNDTLLLGQRDQHNLPVKTRLCRHCGLIYISPRMTKEWYGKYYEIEYRNQRSRYKGQPSLWGDLDAIFLKGQKFGRGLAKLVTPYILPGVTIEVGSGAGGVLSEFREVAPNIIPFGVEPSPVEAAYAESRGIPTEVCLLENIAKELPKAANIICVRTLNHLLDPKNFFIWAHHQLVPGGKLILAVLDFRHSCKRIGSIRRAVQIDHVYMFINEVLRAFVEAAGFDIEFLDVNEYKSFRELAQMKGSGLTGQHVRLVAKKADRPPFYAAAVPAIGENIARSMRWHNVFPYFFLFRGHRLWWQIRKKFLI